MDIDKIINNIIDKGETSDLAEMTDYERGVFLIFEAEVYCDMEGIDSFIDNYNEENIIELVNVYREIGAIDLSDGFSCLIRAQTEEKNKILDELNEMITSRKGYNYDSIKNWVIKKL